MGLEELLQDIRNLYLESFVAEVQANAEDEEIEVALEPALRDDDGSSVTEGTLALPVRVDMAVFRDGEIESLGNIEVDEMYDFEPVEFVWGDGMAVQLLPFTWDAMSLVVPKRSDLDWTPLRTWFLKWFRDEEDDASDPELLGAVHRLGDPVEEEQSTVLTIDLGSAPLEAFEEMLDAIEAIGIEDLLIGFIGNGQVPAEGGAVDDDEELDEEEEEELDDDFEDDEEDGVDDEEFEDDEDSEEDRP